ncbi:hypothetical protein PN499_02570 [Kamptonema animale CS-326]|uniref:hypothetical protein n=1 Tax=Kamptonema animale TaxID=92934 RepID=UPI00232E0D18|nr:hypothetical protein [Kamptonema animale]MDB9510091.1 hypothetical protein [Kamptonema animale CS-326]
MGIIIVGLYAAVMWVVGVYLLRIVEHKAEQIAQANQKITNFKVYNDITILVLK